MKLRVDLLPKNDYQDVVVLIDVLRSCTVAPILFDNGLEKLSLCPSLRMSRDIAAKEGALLLGERRGMPPEGFNYGNSPAELRHVSFGGQSVVMVSENAPKSLPAVAGAKHVLLGALYNADAVVERALSLAQTEVALVCCGFGDNEDLDDALTAGYLAARLKQQGDFEPQGAALMCISLLKAFPDPLDALWQSRAGHYLRRLELHEDIAIAACISQSAQVPVLTDTDDHDGVKLYRFAMKAG